MSMSDSGERDRPIIFSEYQIVHRCKVCSEFIVHIRIGPQHIDLMSDRCPPIVESDKLLVQVIEARDI